MVINILFALYMKYICDFKFNIVIVESDSPLSRHCFYFLLVYLTFSFSLKIQLLLGSCFILKQKWFNLIEIIIVAIALATCLIILWYLYGRHYFAHYAMQCNIYNSIKSIFNFYRYIGSSYYYRERQWYWCEHHTCIRPTVGRYIFFGLEVIIFILFLKKISI